MRKQYHIRRLFNLSISDEHMFYKYDLTIYLFGLSLLLMWKLTDSGKSKRSNYLSFNVYSRSYKQLLRIHI